MQADLLLIWTGEAGRLHSEHGFPNRPCALQWFHGVCGGLPRGGKAALFEGSLLIAAGRRSRAGAVRWRVR